MTDFTWAGYVRLLRHIQHAGPRLVAARAFPSSGPAVLLRHDIDFSVARAVRMAELDAEAGVRSTFFVLLTAPFYNALSGENVDRLRAIHALGHEIGLHYDASLLDGMAESEMEAAVVSLVEALSRAVGTEVTSISQHKPATSRIHPRFTRYRDMYAPEFSRDIAYLSDSRMRWGADDVEGFFDANPRCQVLIHPVWWTQAPSSLAEIFTSLRSEIDAGAGAHLDEFRRGIEAYYARNQIPVR